jgi:Uma2 family endonuclease
MDSAEERRHMPMVQAKVWTLEELHSLPDDGNKYELLHGELFVTPAPTFDHETTIARLHAVLLPFVMAHGRDTSTAETRSSPRVSLSYFRTCS